MARQGVDAEAALEIIRLSPGKQFGHVLKIDQPVVDRRGREQEELLDAVRAFDEIVEPPVARGAGGFTLDAAAPGADPGIAEVAAGFAGAVGHRLVLRRIGRLSRKLALRSRTAGGLTTSCGQFLSGKLSRCWNDHMVSYTLAWGGLADGVLMVPPDEFS
jgi:hypothetical protein